jgi:hypothetical protein
LDVNDPFLQICRKRLFFQSFKSSNRVRLWAKGANERKGNAKTWKERNIATVNWDASSTACAGTFCCAVALLSFAGTNSTNTNAKWSTYTEVIQIGIIKFPFFNLNFCLALETELKRVEVECAAVHRDTRDTGKLDSFAGGASECERKSEILPLTNTINCILESIFNAVADSTSVHEEKLTITLELFIEVSERLIQLLLQVLLHLSLRRSEVSLVFVWMRRREDPGNKKEKGHKLYGVRWFSKPMFMKGILGLWRYVGLSEY